MQAFILGLILAVFSLYSYSDIISIYTTGNENLTLSYRDDQHIRVDRSGGGYSVINGNRAVAVLNQGNGSVVLDVDQAANVLESIGVNQQVSIPDSRDVTLVDTGEYREVAGYMGKVFRVSDGRGTYRLVLSNNPRVIAASDAMRHFFRRFATALRNERGARILALDATFRNHPYRGLLHVEGDGGVRLMSISEGTRPENFYKLPGNTINFGIPGLVQ